MPYIKKNLESSNTAFTKEIRTQRLLTNLLKGEVNIPPVLDTDEATFFSMEEIKGCQRWDLDNSKLLVSSLVKFALCGDEVAKKQREYKVKLPSFTIILLFRLIGAFIRASGVRFKVLATLPKIISLHQKQKRLDRTILVHNDAHRKNVLEDENGKLHMIDFELCALSSRWVFIDIVNMATDLKTQSFNSFVIDEFYRELKETDKEFADALDVSAQIQMGLMYKALRRLSKRRHSPEVTQSLIEFLSKCQETCR